MTPTQTYRMYRSLAKELLYPRGIDIPRYRTGVSAPGAFAHADFDLDLPGTPVTEIVVDRARLQFVDEEEVEYILRHELAHAAAGFVANHGPRWKATALEMRTYPYDYFHIRRYMEMCDHFFQVPWGRGKTPTADTPLPINIF